MSIDALLQEGEGTTLEFKENTKSENKLIEAIIAFSNTSGGRLLIGIQDKNHQIVGVEDPHKVSEGIANKIHDLIEPRILPNIEVVPYRNTHLILIEIYPSFLRPHYVKLKGKEKGTYIRIGSTTRVADLALLRVIERSTTIKTYDEELFYETSYEGIDRTAVSQFFDSYKRLQPSDFISLGIMAKVGTELIPTYGGILLFGKNRLKLFPDAWVQVGVFEGVDKTQIVDTQKITSYFPQAIDEALNFVKKNLRIGLNIEDARHQEVWEIPKVALREALINAVVHTDYSLGTPMRISVFEDRVEIENSAVLLWGLTFADLKAGVSKLRNPIIARVFNELGLIEQWGSGIQRMIRVCQEAGLEPPLFEEIGPRIRVTFFKKAMAQPMIDEGKQLILGLLSFCGPLSTHQMTKCMNIGRRSVINRLNDLVETGQITELAQSQNDPKKKYALTLKGGTKKTKKTNIIHNTFWNDGSGNPRDFSVEFRLTGRHCLQLIFSESILEDYFVDNTISPWHERAEVVIKDVVNSDPLFRDILLTALGDEKVQESFKRRELARYNISPRDFYLRDYRQKYQGIATLTSA